MISIEGTVLELVCEILQLSADEVDMNSKIDLTRNWDSLTNMDVLLEVESQFAISFDVAELEAMDNVRSICQAVRKRFS